MNEKASLHERRAQALAAEMEESRALLDSAERGKRQTEAELGEARVAVNEMQTINSKASAEKRNMEGNVHTMQAEIDDMLHQAKNSEEKAKKAMVDAARLADELRAEQDHTASQANAKRALETQMGELENRLAEATDHAMRGGRSAMAKLEGRVRELEHELGNVQSRTGESMKMTQKAERKVIFILLYINSLNMMQIKDNLGLIYHKTINIKMFCYCCNIFLLDYILIILKS